jgi:hypothetical protein
MIQDSKEKPLKGIFFSLFGQTRKIEINIRILALTGRAKISKFCEYYPPFNEGRNLQVAEMVLIFFILGKL